MTTTCSTWVAPEVPVSGAVPPEPTELRDGLRALALDSPPATTTAAQLEAASQVAALLAAAVPTELEARGIEPETLGVAAASLRREIWLWVVGERRWAPTVESVIGRAARRSPAA